MQIAKWGNSLAVRLPSSLVATLGLKAGDDIEIIVAAPKRFEIRRSQQIDDHFAQLQALPKLPSGFAFNRDEANAR
jgi:antitoxin MazE